MSSTISMKKMAFVAIATAINAGLMLCAGPLSKSLRLPDSVLPFYLLGMIVSWSVVFAVLLFLASPATDTPRKRAARVLGETTIAMVIFCAVLLYPVAHLH